MNKSEQNKMTYKQQYKVWATNSLQIEDSTKQQYLSTLEKLSLIVKYDIFEINNIQKITELYKDLLKEQKVVNGKYYVEERSSSGLKGWYSASVKTYINFLESKKNLKSNSENNIVINNTPPKFNLKSFISDCETSGLKYNSELTTRYISSLATKPFVLLSGLSGSGKTKLAQAFAQWICESEEQYCIVPVGADWTNREPLLGYVNALEPNKYILPENKALELIIKANEDTEKPYFLILDEMNLSHVERYFADFLSVMESKDKFKLHSSDLSLDGGNEIKVKREYSWPQNLFVVGTVNIDETTYMFSPKVLDRANVIEFRVSEKEMED